MDVTAYVASINSLTTLLAPLFGVYAGAVSLVIFGLLMIAVLVFPNLKVADANSSSIYKILFGLLARSTGNFGHNAPIPASGLLAGGIVPTPRILPTTPVVVVSPRSFT